MTDDEHRLHQQIGELIADVRALKEHGEHTVKRVGRIEQRLKEIDQKVTQHRTGWQIFMWIGGVALTISGILVGVWIRLSK